MFSKNSITVKNIIFIIMVIILLRFLSHITAIVMLFFAAYVLACSLNPLVDKFSTKMSRPLSASIVMSGVTLIVFAIILPIIVIAVRQIELFVMSAPKQFTLIKAFVLKQQILGQSVLSMINLPSIVEPVSNFTKSIVEQSIALTLNFASALVYLLAMCVITYYFIVDKELIRKGFMLLFPDHIKQKADTIMTTISEKIGRYIVAQLTVIASVGICVMIPLLCLKIDCAVLLGVISAILDLIPVIGPTIAGIICVFMCWSYGPVIVGLIIIFFLLAQWIENNFIRPYIFGKFFDLHPLIIFFALFVTAKYLGIIGVVLAPAIAATIAVLIDELYIKPINRKTN